MVAGAAAVQIEQVVATQRRADHRWALVGHRDGEGRHLLRAPGHVDAGQPIEQPAWRPVCRRDRGIDEHQALSAGRHRPRAVVTDDDEHGAQAVPLIVDQRRALVVAEHRGAGDLDRRRAGVLKHELVQKVLLPVRRQHGARGRGNDDGERAGSRLECLHFLSGHVGAGIGAAGQDQAGEEDGRHGQKAGDGCHGGSSVATHLVMAALPPHDHE